MPQKRMSPSGGDRNSATVSRTCDHAICGQLCKPSARSSSMTVWRYIPRSAHLGQAHVVVDVAEQGDGRTETLPVADGRPLARFQVLTRNAKCAVALLAEGGSALSVRRLQRGRVHLVLPLVPGVAVAHSLDGVRLKFGKRRAAQHVDVPRLDVRSRRRPGGGGQDALNYLFRDGLVGESAHRPSTGNRFVDIHYLAFHFHQEQRERVAES